MAQTGFTPISIYYSSTATNVPTAGNLVAGELAINTADGKLFYKDSAGVVQVIGTKGGVGSSTTTQVLYNSSGLVVGSANMTFSGTALTLANDASISGFTVGKGGGAQADNIAIGVNALAVNTGASNMGVGYFALKANTSGARNAAFGVLAMALNTTGNYNSAFGGEDSVGYPPLYSNTTGSNNTAIGSAALALNTTASNNTAVGYQAGYTGTTSAYNTYLGYQAGYTANYSGNGFNTCIGAQVGYSLTTGYGNTFIGGASSASGYFVTTGNNNTILGGFNGNASGLDIRTASNYIVLSDGAGNPRGYSDGSGNWTFTGSLKPSQTAGIIGTTTNNSANAGSVGEYIDSFVVTTAVGTTATTLTSITLTAGDWDISGCVELNGSNGVTSIQAAINTTTNSFTGTSLGKDQLYSPSSTFAGGIGAVTMPRIRAIISSTTTYYLIGALGTTATNCNGYISARRMR